jgi:hypothetical protein
MTVATSSAWPSMADASEGVERGKESEQWGHKVSRSGSAATIHEEAGHAVGGRDAWLVWLPRPGHTSAF